jgi:hypothetical protein
MFCLKCVSAEIAVVDTIAPTKFLRQGFRSFFFFGRYASVRCTDILIDGEAVNKYYKFRTLGKIYLIRCFYTNCIITIRNNNVNNVNNILVHGALLGVVKVRTRL